MRIAALIKRAYYKLWLPCAWRMRAFCGMIVWKMRFWKFETRRVIYPRKKTFAFRARNRKLSRRTNQTLLQAIFYRIEIDVCLSVFLQCNAATTRGHISICICVVWAENFFAWYSMQALGHNKKSELRRHVLMRDVSLLLFVANEKTHRNAMPI